MGADPILVQGAYRAAMTNVPLDMSKLYAAEYALDVKLIQDVTDFFTSKEKEAEAEMDKILNPIEKLQTDIAAGGTPGSERLYDETLFLTNRIKEEYKLALKNKDKKTQHKLLGQLNRVINQNTQAETNLMTAGELIANGHINATATGADKFAALEKIIDFDGGNQGVTYSYDDKGNLSYIVDTGNTEYGINGIVEIKANELNKWMIPHAKGKEATYDKYGKDWMTVGSQGGSFSIEEAEYNIYENILNDKKAFADLTTRKWGGQKQSYQKALANNKDIWKALSEIPGSAKFDFDKSGAIDKGDFANGENAALIIDSLTNPNSENFDWELGRRGYARFLAQGLEKDYNEGRNAWLRKQAAIGKGKGKGKEKTDYGRALPSHLGGRWRSDDIARDLANQLYTKPKGRTVGMHDDDYEVIEPGKKFKSVSDGKIYTLEQIWDNNVMPEGLKIGGDIEFDPADPSGYKSAITDKPYTGVSLGAIKSRTVVDPLTGEKKTIKIWD